MSAKLIIDDTHYETEVPDKALNRGHGLPDPEMVKAFIPGTIVDVMVRGGSRVREGDTLLLLDAMKMHNEVCSPFDATVRDVLVSRGDRVEKGQLLVRLIKG
jgi:biotin carboxyl carrier protein